MRAVWSFWSKPWLLGSGQRWLSEKHHLLAWILSFETARKHYPRSALVTDDEGARLLVDQLQLEFGHVSTALNALADGDPAFWMLGKLHAYCVQSEPFVHLDTDVFLWKELPEHIGKAPVFTQNPEHFVLGQSHYKPDEIRRALTGQTKGWIPPEWEWSLSHGNPQPAACCGVLGGTHLEFIHYYASLAILMVNEPRNHEGWSLLQTWEHAVSLEQFHLAACVDYHRNRPDSPFRNVSMRYLFDSSADALNPNIAAKIGFTHLWGTAKQNKTVTDRIEKRVRSDYPEHYWRCIQCVKDLAETGKAHAKNTGGKRSAQRAEKSTFAPYRALLLTIERSADRRAFSVAQLRAEGLEFEFIEGLDGHLCEPLPRTGTWEMKNTELACYYTHCLACRRLLSYGWPHALILEDDFLLLESGRLGSVLEHLPPDCDFLALHRLRIQNDPAQIYAHGEKFNRLRPCALCLPGYVISGRLAAHVLCAHSLASMPIDHLFCEISKDLSFGFYELVRPIVGVSGSASTIHG